MNKSIRYSERILLFSCCFCYLPFPLLYGIQLYLYIIQNAYFFHVLCIHYVYIQQTASLFPDPKKFNRFIRFLKGRHDLKWRHEVDQGKQFQVVKKIVRNFTMVKYIAFKKKQSECSLLPSYGPKHGLQMVPYSEHSVMIKF